MYTSAAPSARLRSSEHPDTTSAQTTAALTLSWKPNSPMGRETSSPVMDTTPAPCAEWTCTPPARPPRTARRQQKLT
eukprot:813335-Prorocentrum_minimum.AAC.1